MQRHAENTCTLIRKGGSKKILRIFPRIGCRAVDGRSVRYLQRVHVWLNIKIISSTETTCSLVELTHQTSPNQSVEESKENNENTLNALRKGLEACNFV